MKNIFISTLFVLVFASCSNFMNMSSSTGTGIRITIISDIDAARTVYPLQPIFTRYKLEAARDSEDEDSEKIEIEIKNGKNSTNISLPPGEWNIKATGFVKIDNTEYTAAEGTAAVIVTDGEIIDVIITISPIQDSSQVGFFSFSASYPREAVIRADLYIYDIGSNYDEELIIRWDIDDMPNIYYIAPGCYMMTLLIDVKDSIGNYYRTVSWTEVIYIYPGMETHAARAFSLAELNSLINSNNFTINGTATVKINNNNVGESWVVAYNSSADTRTEIGRAQVSNGSWQILLGAEYNGAEVFFSVLAIDRAKGYNVFQDTGISEILSGDGSEIALGTVNITTLMLSGTADITVNGFRPENAYIEIYRAQNTIWVASCNIVASDNYSWETPWPLGISGNSIYIRAEGYDYNGDWFSVLISTRPLPTENTVINLSGAYTYP